MSLAGPSGSHSVSTKGTFHCGVCNRDFQQEDGLQMHLKASKTHRKTERSKISLEAGESDNTPPIIGGTSEREKTANIAMQKTLSKTTPRAPISNVGLFYCNACERDFKLEAGFQEHSESKRHKKEARKQKRSEPVEPVATSTLSTYESMYLHQYETFPSQVVKPSSSTTAHSTSKALDVGAIRAREVASLSTFTELPIRNLISAKAPVSPSPHLQQDPNLNTKQPSHPSHIQGNEHIKRAAIRPGSDFWSKFSSSEHVELCEALSKQCHSSEDLLKNSYLLRPYGPRELSDLCKCKNCGGVRRKLQTRLDTKCVFHTGKRQRETQKDGSKPYTCCSETNQGCIFLPTHSYVPPDPRIVTKHQEMASTPPRNHQTPKRLAVVLDCEMAGVQGGANELILFSAVDYLTGETITNTLVQPTKRVVDWRSRYSGVTAAAMAIAKSKGQTLNGWPAARANLWHYVDADTILVGHALHNDLKVLRMIHTKVVDSEILTRKAVSTTISRRWSLKTLSAEMLGIAIQANGRIGHDCQEDTLAAREVVLWCTTKVEELEAWAREKREEEQRLLKEQQKQRQEKIQKKEEKDKKQAQKEKKKDCADNDDDDDDYWSDREVLLWEDIAEDCGYPHPDTGYDPWSD